MIFNSDAQPHSDDDQWLTACCTVVADHPSAVQLDGGAVGSHQCWAWPWLLLSVAEGGRRLTSAPELIHGQVLLVGHVAMNVRQQLAQEQFLAQEAHDLPLEQVRQLPIAGTDRSRRVQALS